MLFERGIDICHETIGLWWNWVDPLFAAEIRKRRVHDASYSRWRWHLDEVFVRISGEAHYLWRAVDHEGEVLEVLATKFRDRRAALRFLKRAYDNGPASVLRRRDERDWHPGASGLWKMARQSSREFTSAVPTTRGRDGQVQGHQGPTEIRCRPRLDPQPLQPRPPPNHRDIFKQNRSAALAEWRQLAV